MAKLPRWGHGVASYKKYCKYFVRGLNTSIHMHQGGIPFRFIVTVVWMLQV